MAGIGPISFAGMMLADLGAEVTRIERPAGGGFAWGASPVLDRGRVPREVDLKVARRGGGGARPRGRVRGPDRGLPAGRDGAARARPRGVPRPQPGAGLRADDRLGTVGPLRPHRRPRHHLPGDLRRAPHGRRAGPQAGASGQPARRLRRAAAPTSPSASSARCCTRGRPGSARWSTRRSSTAPPRSPGCCTASSSMGAWRDERGVNLLDGGAPFYDTYRCADGGWVAVGALEPQFYAALLEALGMAGDEEIANHLDPATWPAIRERFTAKFAERARDEWHELFADSDCCVAPVLSMREAREDGHNRDRGVFVEVGGMPQPAPAPRFSVTEPDLPAPAGPSLTGRKLSLGGVFGPSTRGRGEPAGRDRHRGRAGDRRRDRRRARRRRLERRRRRPLRAGPAAALRDGERARPRRGGGGGREARRARRRGARRGRRRDRRARRSPPWSRAPKRGATSTPSSPTRARSPAACPAWELPADQQRALLEVNLEAVMLAARLVVPALLGRPRPRSGRFVAVTSSGATRGMSGLAAYSAAKAGVGGLRPRPRRRPPRQRRHRQRGRARLDRHPAPRRVRPPLRPPLAARLRPPPAPRAPARARRGRRHHRLPPRPRRRRHHRRHRPRRRRPHDLTPTSPADAKLPTSRSSARRPLAAPASSAGGAGSRPGRRAGAPTPQL